MKLAQALSVGMGTLLLLGLGCSKQSDEQQAASDAGDQSSTQVATESPAGIGHDVALGSGTSVLLDGSLTREEINQLQIDFSQLRRLPVLDHSKQKLYLRTFGGPTVSDVIRYIDERVHLILSESVNLDTRVALINTDNRTADLKAVEMATNVSPVMFLVSLYESGPIEVRSFSKRFPVNATRVGIIQLGPGFRSGGTIEGRPINKIDRIGTLVHEARHSDCTGGLKRSLVKDIKTETSKAVENWKSQSICGHPHFICPKGHEFEGLPACDSHAWGPYAMGAIYDLVISRDCRNCSEEDIQAAVAGTADSFSRLVLSENTKTIWNETAALADVRKMLNGEFSWPDMASLGLIEGQ